MLYRLVCGTAGCSNRWCLWGLLGNNPEVSDCPSEPPHSSCLSNHLLPLVHFSALHLFWDELIFMCVVLSQTARCCFSLSKIDDFIFFYASLLLLLHFKWKITTHFTRSYMLVCRQCNITYRHLESLFPASLSLLPTKSWPITGLAETLPIKPNMHTILLCVSDSLRSTLTCTNAEYRMAGCVVLWCGCG